MFHGTPEETLYDIDVNIDMIRAKLSKLRTDKAPGADGMSPWPVSYTHLTLPTILRV